MLIPLRLSWCVFAICCLPLLSGVVAAQAISLTSETELLAILAAEDADPSEKAIACKRLAIYGSEAASEELGKLLADPRLASWARIALEAIPGEAPAAVLRNAANQLEGLRLIGVINSLAARRDAGSVELFSRWMQQGSPEVASSAAFALGKVGSVQAAEQLLAFLPDAPESVRSAVAEGCNLCADKLRISDDSEMALKLYDAVRMSDLPRQRIVEASRGAILARGDDGIPLLVELLRSDDYRMVALGLQTARELESGLVGSTLISEISSARPDRAALLVEALGDLSGQADLNSLQALARGGTREVRLAAIGVLGRIGDASVIGPMLEVARESGDLQAAVRAALVTLPDDGADQEILKRLPDASEDKQILLELVGLRQLEATDELVRALSSRDPNVRAAAIQALGQTVPQSRLQVLIDQLLAPGNPEDFDQAARALRVAAIRMPDREACARVLGEALQDAASKSKTTLLETIAAVGGTNALEIVGRYGSSSEESLRDLSTRLLGEWMTIDAAPVLLELATTGPADRFQVRSLRGYIRLARQFVMPDERRAEMCRRALEAARGLSEQRLVMDVLKRYPNAQTLEIAIESMEKPGLREEAKQAVLAIGKKLADNPEIQQRIRELGL
jgi:HEAT repeat protein